MEFDILIIDLCEKKKKSEIKGGLYYFFTL